ncbi:MAG: fumarylacetoacetase [Aquihabitans sp.]
MSDTWAPMPDDSGFNLFNLPVGVARFGDGRTTVVTRIGDDVLPLSDALDGRSEQAVGDRGLVDSASTDGLLASGPATWMRVRERTIDFLTDEANERPLTSAADVDMLLPMTVGDYVDFYSSLHHATNLGRLFRPDVDPLLPNWRHLPVGYHGRSATVAVSGTPVVRPTGLVTVGDDVLRRPSAALDFELEVGFVMGPGNPSGQQIEPDQAGEHVFGVVLVNDWSARDIQAFEYQPLGPFLGKSFLTTVSPWIIPLDALTGHLVTPPEQDPLPDPLLTAHRPWGLDLELTVHIGTTEVTRTNFRHLYWTFAQQLAHLTSNGAITRPGDLFASGTVSGPTPGECGSMIEATWRGRDPLLLDDGTERAWLNDGDTVTMSGWCGGVDDQPRIDFGHAVGTVQPANRPVVTGGS